jgi:hypothetical protein
MQSKRPINNGLRQESSGTPPGANPLLGKKLAGRTDGLEKLPSQTAASFYSTVEPGRRQHQKNLLAVDLVRGEG